MEAKNLVIYHASCADGIGAATTALKALGNGLVLQPLQYGFERNWTAAQWQTHVTGRDVYLLDFSLPPEFTAICQMHCRKFVWRDHHKTAFETHGLHGHFPLYRETRQGSTEVDILLNNDRSGAYLAWEYFFPNKPVPDFISHIDDRDRWQFALLNSRAMHAGLTTYGLNQPVHSYEQFFNVSGFTRLVTEGRVVTKMLETQIDGAMPYAKPCEILGHKGLAVNGALNISEIGNRLATKSGTYGLVWWSDGEKAICSLRSNDDYDVSAIAKQFGGGGHKNAAGFSVPLADIIPILNPNKENT